MDLRRYFQPIRGDALPDPKGPLSTTIPRQAIAEANKRVQEAAIAKASKKRGSYGHFDAKTRAAMGKCSCENGVVAAARYYSKALHRPVNESTVRYIKKAYLEEQSRMRRAENDTAIASLPTKKRGRPLLLGDELDSKVQAYATTLQLIGEWSGLRSTRREMKYMKYTCKLRISTACMCWFKHLLTCSTFETSQKHYAELLQVLKSHLILWKILISLNQWLQFLVSPLCPLRFFLWKQQPLHCIPIYGNND